MASSSRSRPPTPVQIAGCDEKGEGEEEGEGEGEREREQVKVTSKTVIEGEERIRRECKVGREEGDERRDGKEGRMKRK